MTIESTPGEGTTIYVRVPVTGATDGTDPDLLADDHAVLRAGLRMLISSQRDLEVVGEANNGDEAVRKAAALRPDVALVHITMPGSGGIKAIERIRQAAPATRVLVLTMHDVPAYLRAALAAGSTGYVASVPPTPICSPRSAACTTAGP